jgi:hypothetical protein
MSLVRTTAPISIDNLKQYFTDKSITYEIDYVNSTLTGTKLLTYLSNLDIPADIDLSDVEEKVKLELLRDYLISPSLVSIKSLEFETIKMLLEYKHMTDATTYQNFINDNKELVESWISKLDSLTLYNMFIIDIPEMKDFVKQFPEDSTDSTEGVNFVSLLKHEFFYTLYGAIDQTNLKYYSKYFSEYMFKGKNLYSYWANNSNPMYLLTVGISEQLFKNEEYTQAKQNSIKELEELVNVTPV